MAHFHFEVGEPEDCHHYAEHADVQRIHGGIGHLAAMQNSVQTNFAEGIVAHSGFEADGADRKDSVHTAVRRDSAGDLVAD